MTGYRRLTIIVLILSTPALIEAEDVTEIVARACATLKADWDAVPAYSFLQRDTVTQSGKTTIVTNRVLMIDGSDYYMPVATNDQPFSTAQQSAEIRKLHAEIQRRTVESSGVRRKRIANYREERQQNGRIIAAFPSAFYFVLSGEDSLGGRAVYVLSARPKPLTGPSTREAKVLAGMSGRMWVEKDSLQIVRAEANVLTPVSIFGIFARVLPGTRFEIEAEPTGANWLISRLEIDMTVSKFWFRSAKVTISTYSGYEPNDEVIRDLLKD